MSDGKTYWYEFDQNNTGGSFIHDREAGIAEYVYIEAACPEHASLMAEKHLSNEGSCPCCGDRWYCENPTQYSDVNAVMDRIKRREKNWRDMNLRKFKCEVDCCLWYADGSKRYIVRSAGEEI